MKKFVNKEFDNIKYQKRINENEVLIKILEGKKINKLIQQFSLSEKIIEKYKNKVYPIYIYINIKNYQKILWKNIGMKFPGK